MKRPTSRKYAPLLISLTALGWLAGCSPAEELPPEEPRGLAGQVEQSATVAAYWTRFISEEDGSGPEGGVRCAANEAVVGVECMGDFCDNVRVRCDTFQNTTGLGRWTTWVEHTAGTQVKCGTNEWMAGIKCWGDWCDNVSIWCVPTNNGAANCAWTTQYWSEENGAFTAPPSRYLAGIECTGNHCDNKKYWVCETRPAASNSCNGRCGGASSGGTCFCDDACESFEDCCTDKERFCG